MNDWTLLHQSPVISRELPEPLFYDRMSPVHHDRTQDPSVRSRDARHVALASNTERPISTDKLQSDVAP